MKKIVKIVVLVLALFMFKSVNAANYEIRELIPVDIKTNVLGDYFRYKGIIYKKGSTSIKIDNVQNKTDEERYLSIFIGLFNSDKENIGTINYCEDDGTKLAQRDERSVDIPIESSSITKKAKVKDIKYISVIGENENCRKDGELDYVGQTVDEVGLPKNATLDDDSHMLLTIISVIVGILVFIFVYNFLFSNKYKNMDGEDVRQEYAYINKEKRLEREYNNRVNPPKPKEVKKNKTDEQRQQEIREKELEDNGDSDLRNMYK